VRFNKKTPNELAKIQTRATNPGLRLERIPSRGKIQELGLGKRIGGGGEI